MNKDWLVGFLEGECSFGIGIGPDKTWRTGYSVQPTLEVAQVVDELEGILNIRNYLKTIGINSTLRKISPHKSWSPNARSQILLSFYDRTSLLNLIELMEGKFILPNKKLQFQIWKEIVLKLEENRKLITREVFLEIIKLADELKQLRKPRMRRKYSVEYFKNIWNQ